MLTTLAVVPERPDHLEVPALLPALARPLCEEVIGLVMCRIGRARREAQRRYEAVA